MMVEHTFITTLDQAAAFQLAGEILTKLGFVAESQPTSDSIVFRRGMKSAQVAKRSDQLPQRAMLHFDRGRIQLAASLEEARSLRAESLLQKELLISLAGLLESCLSRGEPMATARSRWDSASAKIYNRHQRRRRTNGIVLLVFLGISAGAVAICLLATR
jgi:hypothetical protein